MIRWGVSPAWMISRYRGTFGPSEIEKEIPRIESAGFQSFQLEIFDQESLELWESEGAQSVLTAISRSALSAEIFVAHCLLQGFSSLTSCLDESLKGKAERIAAVVAQFPMVKTVVIPLPRFEGDPENAAAREVFLTQWRRVQAPFVRRGVSIAIEVLPGSMGGTPARLNWLLTRPEFSMVGLNLDTGHFHSAGFNIPELIRQHRIYATHLCDNDGIHNDSLAPGEGTIQWYEVFHALDACPYQGTWDLEIICEPERIETVYRNALNTCISRIQEMHSVNTEGV